MAGTAYTLMDTSKMIGQMLRNGSVFRENTSMHPLISILLGDASETMYDQGKGFNFERLSRITGTGPRWFLDGATKSSEQLVLGASTSGGEGAAVNFAFANPTLSIETGWWGMQTKSTIYESDMTFQNGKELVTEDIQKTEAARIAEGVKRFLAQNIYGSVLPAKNQFGGLQALISDGLTQAQREAAYTDRNGTIDESANKSYGVDSSDSNYAFHRSYVKPWTTTKPTPQAMSNTIEKVQTATGGRPKYIFEGVTQYQSDRDAIENLTSGSIITTLDPKLQKLGIAAFTYRGNEFIMDPDIDNYVGTSSLTQQFAIDPAKYILHMKKDVVRSTYKRLDGVLNAAWFWQDILYSQMTLGSRRTQIKWRQY